jgi:hypothetical protein
VADRQLNNEPMDIDVNYVRAPKIKPNDTSVGRPVVTKAARAPSSPSFDFFAELTDGESGDDEGWPEDG